MTKRSFDRKINLIWKELEDSVELITEGESDIIFRAEEVLMETDKAIRNLKKLVLKYSFSDWSEEIRFFKTTKPQFVSVYIFYSKILAVEAARPAGNLEVLREYYQKERKDLWYFFEEHKDFLSYYRRNATYLDKKYFLRFRFDFKLKLSPELYSYDEEFSTSHDHLVAQILAYELFDKYLTNRIGENKSDSHTLADHKKLEWTASKVALTELIFALHQTKCFNGGQADLAEVVRWAEKSLNISLGNYHKTFGEIRLRKSHPTRFLMLLNNNLNSHIDALDE